LKIINSIIIISIFLLVSACNKQDNKKSSIYANYITQNNLESTNKITAFRFQGWHALDNKHLIISSNHNKSYLIGLDFYCSDLRHAINIVLDQTMSSSLSAKFDSIIVPLNPKIKCRIKSIHQISKDQKNQLNALR